ncbi:MAG TPA: hypothetical protein VFQ95_00630 [Rhodanobacteraceae bacterium]|nr:hypothetical protein [Rhodanobacteraceae bacterium]
MPETISMRLNGSADRLETLVTTLRGLPEVDAVVELDLDLPGADLDDQDLDFDVEATAGVPRHRDVQLDVEGEREYAHVCGLLEVLAAESDVVLEWLDDD